MNIKKDFFLKYINKIDRLPNFKRNLEIIKLRSGLIDGEVYTFKEISNITNITVERVRQIEAYFWHRIKKYCTNKEKEFIKDNLENNYIKTLLAKNSTLDTKDIPNELVEAKKHLFKLNRFLKNSK